MPENFSVDLETIYPVIEEKLLAGGTVTFGPKGISMLPLIRQGVDSIKLAPINKKLQKYDVPLYRRSNGQFVLHRVISEKNGIYTMRGDNQIINEYGINHSQIIGIMTEIIKPEGVIKVSDKEYIKYTKKQVLKQTIKSFIFKLNVLLKKILIKLNLYKKN